MRPQGAPERLNGATEEVEQILPLAPGESRQHLRYHGLETRGGLQESPSCRARGFELYRPPIRRILPPLHQAHSVQTVYESGHGAGGHREIRDQFLRDDSYSVFPRNTNCLL